MENESDNSCVSNNTVNRPHVNCSCCNYNSGEEMYECSDCHRKYHDYCHIPIVVLRSEIIKKTWQCTMCGDMNTISKYLGEDGEPENISVGTVGRQIAERILMELYCNTDRDNLFRERPNKNIFPRYYQNKVHAVALNDVRDFLINKNNYKLSEFMKDLKLVFVNSLSYYEVYDSNFNSARKLLNRLNSLYHLWIMYPTRNKGLTEFCSE